MRELKTLFLLTIISVVGLFSNLNAQTKISGSANFNWTKNIQDKKAVKTEHEIRVNIEHKINNNASGFIRLDSNVNDAQVDRAYVKYTNNKLNLKAGRFSDSSALTDGLSGDGEELMYDISNNITIGALYFHAKDANLSKDANNYTILTAKSKNSKISWQINTGIKKHLVKASMFNISGIISDVKLSLTSAIAKDTNTTQSVIGKQTQTYITSKTNVNSYDLELTVSKNGKNGGKTGLLDSSFDDSKAQFKDSFAKKVGVFVKISKKILNTKISLSHYKIDNKKDSDFNIAYDIGKDLSITGNYSFGNDNNNVKNSELAIDLKYKF